MNPSQDENERHTKVGLDCLNLLGLCNSGRSDPKRNSWVIVVIGEMQAKG